LLQVGGRKLFEPFDIAKAAKDARYWNDKALYTSGMKIFDLIKEKFSNLGNSVDYITIEEAISGNIPSNKEIRRREKSWIYFNGNFYSDIRDVKKFLLNFEVVIKEEIINRKTLIVKGVMVYEGCVTGKVKIVFTLSDVAKVENKDILVSPMTTPDLMSAMKKASAFVTDEGGLLCHAAIIARELKKPCVIGTKIATEVLKDGDLVEVDANKGVVKILKRNE